MSLKELLKITDSKSEMIAIGRQIFESRPDIYDVRNMAALNDALDLYATDASPEEREDLLYSGLYDYWMYGASLKEAFFYDFFHKTHAEKSGYLTFRNRYLYMRRLNADPDASEQLADKYQCFLKLREHYHREIIRIADESDFPLFDDFTKRHQEFVVKPNGLGYGWGVHLETVAGKNKADVFHGILQEGADVKQRHHFQKTVTDYVLEEIIRQPESLGVLHPSSVNCIRLTTIVTDGEVHFFYPRIKVGKNGNFISNAGDTGLLVGIDEKTGVCNTDGWDERGNIFINHPNTHIPLKGFQIPDWDELLKLGRTIALEVSPAVNYVGWDIAYSDRGWCIIEANPNGEFICQLIMQKGLKAELEAIMRWKPEKEFWWE